MDFTKLKKLGATVARPQDQAAERDQMVTAIVKVRQPHYRPALLQVRRQIDNQLFTAVFNRANLRALRADPLVEEVSVATPLPSY